MEKWVQNLCERSFRLNIRENLLMIWVVWLWNGLPQRVVKPPFIGGFLKEETGWPFTKDAVVIGLPASMGDLII